jgi:hypothetical protein
MRRGTLLAISAGLVLVAGVVLLIATGRTGEAPATPAASPSPGPSQAKPTRRPAPETARSPSTTVSSSVPAAEVPEDGSASEPRVYEVGGRIIRDHRKGKRAPVDLPPAMHPADGRKLDSALTQELGQKVKAVMKECTSDLPPEARGVSPRIQGAISIAIKDGQVSVSRTAFQVRDVVGAAVDHVKQCIEEKALAITHPTDESDLASYDLTLSLAL